MSQELADLFGLTLLVSLKKQAHTTAGDQLVSEPHATTSLKERVGTSSWQRFSLNVVHKSSSILPHKKGKGLGSLWMPSPGDGVLPSTHSH